MAERWDLPSLDETERTVLRRWPHHLLATAVSAAPVAYLVYQLSHRGVDSLWPVLAIPLLAGFGIGQVVLFDGPWEEALPRWEADSVSSATLELPVVAPDPRDVLVAAGAMTWLGWMCGLFLGGTPLVLTGQLTLGKALVIALFPFTWMNIAGMWVTSLMPSFAPTWYPSLARRTRTVRVEGRALHYRGQRIIVGRDDQRLTLDEGGLRIVTPTEEFYSTPAGSRPARPTSWPCRSLVVQSPSSR